MIYYTILDDTRLQHDVIFQAGVSGAPEVAAAQRAAVEGALRLKIVWAILSIAEHTF